MKRTEKEPTMISRLSTIAAIFAVLASASLAGAASLHHTGLANLLDGKAAHATMPVVQLPTVVVTAKRSALAPR
jgi:hypothetical protein